MGGVKKPKPIKRRLEPISGKGVYCKPKKVKGGYYSGKVKKGPKKPFTLKQAKVVKKACDEYQSSLKRVGIPILPAKVKLVGTGKANKKRKIVFFQKPVPEKAILSNYFKKAKPQECLKIVDSLLSKVKKAMDYNKEHKKQGFSMDVNFKNWAFVNGELKLIDFFPPRLAWHKSSKILNRQKESKLARLGFTLLYRLSEKRKLDPGKALRIIMFDSIELKNQQNIKWPEKQANT